MKRYASFIGIACALLATARPIIAGDTVKSIVTSIDGRVAVFAQRLGEGKPSVEIGATETYPAASIIKLAVMLTAYEAVDARRIRLDTRVVFREGDVVAGSETFEGARPGQKATLGALLKAMIQQSDNSAANALVGRFGFKTINNVTSKVGLRHTHLRRLFLHFDKTHENVTTAADVGAILLGIERGAHGLSQRFASAKSCRAMIATMLGQEDREKIVRGLPSGIAVANKTGELLGVRHDAAIVDPWGRNPYVLVVLEEKLADQTQGVKGINRISRAVYDRFAKVH